MYPKPLYLQITPLTVPLNVVVYERASKRKKIRVNEIDKECLLFRLHTELYPKPLYLQITPRKVPLNVVVCMKERE